MARGNLSEKEVRTVARRHGEREEFLRKRGSHGGTEARGNLSEREVRTEGGGILRAQGESCDC